MTMAAWFFSPWGEGARRADEGADSLHYSIVSTVHPLALTLSPRGEGVQSEIVTTWEVQASGTSEVPQ